MIINKIRKIKNLVNLFKVKILKIKKENIVMIYFYNYLSKKNKKLNLQLKLNTFFVKIFFK